MAGIADMLVQAGLQTSTQSADLAGASAQGAKIGLELGQTIINAQNQRAQLEQKKAEAEQAKFEKIGNWIETAAKMPDGAAKKAFVNNYIPNGIAALGVQDKIEPTVLKMLTGDPALGSFIVHEVRNGNTNLGILSSPDGVAKLAASPEYQQFGGLEALKSAIDEYRPKIEEAEMKRIDASEGEKRARIMATNKSAQQGIGNLQDLRKEITGHPITKKTLELSDSYTKIRTNLGGKSSGAGDMAGIFAFMKMLDPGSTVREGEYANAENTRGVPDQVRGLYNKAIGGEKLTASQRADFISRAEGMYRDQYAQQQSLNKDYEEIARRTGLDAKLVFAGTKFKAPPGEKKTFSVNPRQKQLYAEASAEDKTTIVKQAAQRFGISEAEAKEKLEAK